MKENNHIDYSIYWNLIDDFHMSKSDCWCSGDQHLTIDMKGSELDIVRGCVYGGYNSKGQLKKHSHQRRLQNSALDELVDKLLSDDILHKSFKDFDELYQYVRNACSEINGLGDLCAYDASVRLGDVKNPKLVPTMLYLHNGTEEGFVNLIKNPNLPFGNIKKTKVIVTTDVPWKEMFGDMSPVQAEIFLCVYKDKIRQCKRFR